MSLDKTLFCWRQSKLSALSNEIQMKLENLQHPKNCKQIKTLYCKMESICGFGCQIHHIMYCILIAFLSNRTLMLNSTEWSYNKKGLDEYFKPISSCPYDSHIPGIILSIFNYWLQFLFLLPLYLIFKS